MLWELFITFAKVGVMTFGGGMAMLPILEREIVQNRKWATEEELAERLGRETGERWFSLLDELFAFVPVFAK